MTALVRTALGPGQAWGSARSFPEATLPVVPLWGVCVLIVPVHPGAGPRSSRPSLCVLPGPGQAAGPGGRWECLVLLPPSTFPSYSEAGTRPRSSGDTPLRLLAPPHAGPHSSHSLCSSCRSESQHRFWKPNELDTELDGTHVSQVPPSRLITFAGTFEPVQHRCRAPRPDGRLCERQDRLKVRQRLGTVGQDVVA